VEAHQENTTAVPTTTTTTPDDVNDEDYPMESSTHADWDEPTGLPDFSKNSAEVDTVQSNSD